MLLGRVYGVDLGSSEIKVYSHSNHKFFQTANLIASRGREIIAVGNDAYNMFEKTPQDINVTSPMAIGAIADPELQQIVLYSILKDRGRLLKGQCDFYFTVPLEISNVEKRAYYNSANGYWLHRNRVFTVEAPIADALQLGIDLSEKNQGSMLVNIGDMTTQFSVFNEGKIIISRRVPYGGHHIAEMIIAAIRRRFGLAIGWHTARGLLKQLGRLSDNTKESRKVIGVDIYSGLPREELINSYVVNDGIMDCINLIAAEMKTFLERIPPQIAYHIAREGIYLTGGTARLPYLDKYLANYTGVTFNLAQGSNATTIKGLSKIISDKTLSDTWAHQLRARKI